ncbi:MAG TPA: hypothetical protein PKY42_04175 [Mesotoga sp.]|nr:hypothetical protein [Mesotoga sp.]
MESGLRPILSRSSRQNSRLPEGTAIDMEQPGKRCGGVGKSLAATPSSLNAFRERRAIP